MAYFLCMMFGQFVTRLERFKILAERPVEILFRNLMKRDNIREHAIARGTGQLCLGAMLVDFAPFGAGVVLLSARIAADRRLGYEHGDQAHLPELRQ